MGFSASGATAVLFVGLLFAVGVAYPAVNTAGERLTDAVGEHEDRTLDRQNTAIEVASVGYNATTDVLTVAANNTGSTVLSVNATDLLVDGAYRQGYATAVDGEAGRTIWVPGEQLNLTVSGVPARPDRLRLVTENGVAVTETGV